MSKTTDLLDEIFQLRLKARVDSRTTACSVQTVHEKKDAVLVQGFVHYAQLDAFVKTTAKEVYAGYEITFKLRVLERRNGGKFAVVTDAAADIWRKPGPTDNDNRDNQALYGTIVRVYFKEGDFTYVQHPDGYVGYVPTRHLRAATAEDYLDWKNGAHVVTLVPVKHGDITIPMGARLRYRDGKALDVDGAPVTMSTKQRRIFDVTKSKFLDEAVRLAESLMDTPYLWGGKSEVGIDCSGFMQTLAIQQGIVLPRDASMQCHVGEIVGYLPDMADLLPGDIIFFMNKNGYVFHVGMYLGDHIYMHSAGATGPTKSSVYKNGKNFMKRYDNSYVYARRVFR